MSWEMGLLIAVLAVAFMAFKMTRGPFGPEISRDELLEKREKIDVVVGCWMYAVSVNSVAVISQVPSTLKYSRLDLA